MDNFSLRLEINGKYADLTLTKQDLETFKAQDKTQAKEWCLSNIQPTLSAMAWSVDGR